MAEQWTYDRERGELRTDKDGLIILFVSAGRRDSDDIDGRVGEATKIGCLAAAAPDLAEAAMLLEAAEDANANCEDCEGEGVPELCGTCFPLFDDARLKRRAAVAKARGEAV